MFANEYADPFIWNDFQTDIRAISSIVLSKKTIRAYLSEQNK